MGCKLAHAFTKVKTSLLSPRLGGVEGSAQGRILGGIRTPGTWLCGCGRNSEFGQDLTEITRVEWRHARSVCWVWVETSEVFLWLGNYFGVNFFEIFFLV